jgi:uncharacterized protein (DUF2236 family)
MLIFAGSAAEFAINKAVDWLFWSNALPNAPIERFFQTVRFAQQLAFGDERQVAAAIDGVNRAHRGVERSRGDHIPQWAYRDVLFMLIDYSERAHAIVFGPMGEDERLEHFLASIGIGRALHIEDLPDDYLTYQALRQSHLDNNTEHSQLTDELYARYREHLGSWRMHALLDLQASLVPARTANLLNLHRKRRVDLLLRFYRRYLAGRSMRWLYPVLLPRPYGAVLATLERAA